MTNTITFGSVCSGIEAASVAWHMLGWRAAWLAEIEPAPCMLLKHHYPDVPNLGDMNRIPQLLRNGDIPAPDVFCGGTPCQAFSVAGLRNSLDDARGNLSLKFCDIADEIDIQRSAAGLLPCVVKWENVPGVLSTKDNAFGCFLGQLAGEDSPLEPEPRPAAGKNSRWWRWDKKAGQHALSWPVAGAVVGPKRAIAWRVLDAQYFGVAQRRRRVFVVASARDGFDPAAVLFESEGVRRDSAPSRSAGQETTGTLSSRTTGGGGLGTDFECAGGLQPVVGALTTRCGEATQNEVDSHMLVTVMAHGQAGAEIAYDRSPTLTCVHEAPIAVYQPVAHAFDARQSHVIQYGEYTGPLDTLGSTIGLLTSAEFSRTSGAVCVTGDITHTLKAEGFDASEDGTGRGQPIVATYANVGDFGVMRPVDVGDPLRANGGDTGNGGETVVVTAGAMCAHTYSGGMGGRVDMAVQGYVQAVAGTLDANHSVKGAHAWTGRLIGGGMAVRRLTPRECERLQGFPDDYTAVPLPERRAGARDTVRVMADGPRYKALGNSWAVPKVRWLGRRIEARLRELEARG